MNKNRLSISLLFSFCLLSFALVFITNASFLEVSEDLVIVGNGSIDRDFGAQSAPDFSGQKLSETIVPVYSSHVNATSSYRSNFELIMSNNSSIYYESASELTNVKHRLSNDNYKIDVCTGFYYIGTQNKSFSFESSPSLSEALLISDADGRSVIWARVVNESYYRDRTVDSLTWLQGNYTLDWAFLVLDVEYPEAGDDDWLECP
jgi:hypothetical protein